jgi:hypothetical protein
MSKIAASIYIYGFYLLLMGLGLIIIPNLVLETFGFEKTTEIWILMLGLFTLTVAIYYFYSARTNLKGFFVASIAGRLFFFTGILTLTLVFHQNPMLIVIGGVDLLGAVWTISCMRR